MRPASGTTAAASSPWCSVGCRGHADPQAGHGHSASRAPARGASRRALGDAKRRRERWRSACASTCRRAEKAFSQVSPWPSARQFRCQRSRASSASSPATLGARRCLGALHSKTELTAEPDMRTNFALSAPLGGALDGGTDRGGGCATSPMEAVWSACWRGDVGRVRESTASRSARKLFRRARGGSHAARAVAHSRLERPRRPAAQLGQHTHTFSGGNACLLRGGPEVRAVSERVGALAEADGWRSAADGP